jgi:hypothetical protein
MCSQVLDGLKMIFIPKSNANLVMNITCMLLYLSRALYIFECINLSVTRFIFWVSYCKPWFLCPETKKLVFRFCVSILLLAFYPCIVYPHTGDLTNLARYPPLKPNIIFCDYLLDHNLSLRMDHQFKEDRETVPTLKNSSISRRKNISGTYLIYRLFARGRANV